jgi:hypothetical protein
MDDSALLVSLGFARPSAREAEESFRRAFPGVSARGGGRVRAFDERTTIGLMLGQALGRNAPCKDAVRRAQLELGMDVSASTAAFCKARARVSPSTLEEMSERLSAEADALCGLDGFSGVWALDGTTFQVADTDENRGEWPYAAGPKPGCGFPVVGALFAHSLVGKGSSVLVAAPWKAHDFRLYVEASARFREGELHIGDRAFCSFAAFAILSEAGADGIFRGRGWCRKGRRDDVVLGPGDRLTKWPKRQARRSTTVPRERLDGFPDEITVRVITAKIRVRGFRDEDIVLVTSLLDAKKYPKEKILEWYLRRWEIEVSFRDMKTTLRYEFIRGRTPKTVRLELGILVLAYNLMRYVMARGRATGRRRGIASTAAAVMAFIATVQTLYSAGRSLARAFSRLVAAVAADTSGKRKRKNYVRAVKRRPKPYPLLTKPRSEYRPEEVV